MRINYCKNTMIRILAIILSICLLLSFTGCDDSGEVKGNYLQVGGVLLDSGELASNPDYKLLWDKDAAAILFKSADGTQSWSDILYEAYLEGSTNANGNSPIYITVANNRSLEWNTVRSYSEIPGSGSTICKKIENGIRVTYFFDTYEVAVPIDYTLEEDCLKIKINASQILEGGENYKLVSVSLAPNLCSVSNNSKDGYLFVPCGSGAIMKAMVTTEGERDYEGEVYGTEVARQQPKNYFDSEEINLPVFGAAGDGKALMGIIEQGIGSAKIEAKAGNQKVGYSNVWATFYVRGFDEFNYKSHGTGNVVTKRVSEKISPQELSVSYYQLSGSEASYAGMARRYRSYLQEKGVLSQTDKEYSPYSVTLLGGTNITESILGIPQIETKPLTTFTQANDILKELYKNNKVMPTVRLYGFGDNGINPGTITGGDDIDSIYGEEEDLYSLQKYCKENNLSLFYDYELIKFSETGSGFSTSANCAQTAINKRITRYDFSPLRIVDEESGYSILARDKLIEASDEAIEIAKERSNDGVSFSSLGNMAYSDFTDVKYYNKRNIEQDVIKILNNAKKNKLEVAVSSANYYAASAADVIFDTTTKNGDYFAFDECVPFYQMVFHSYKPMYSEAINYSGDYKKDFANAVAFGTGLGFTLTHDYVKESNDLDTKKLYATVYEDNKSLINELVVKSGYAQVYDATKNAELINYEISKSGVSKTEYSNSKVVYVNHTNKTVTCPIGTIEPYGFLAR